MASEKTPLDFYVYAHRRGDTGEIFYIGKGRGRRAHERHGRNSLWTRISRKHGYTVEILCDGLAEVEAFTIERKLIAAHHPACNFTEGGEGISGYRHTNETKAALRRAHQGRKQDPAVVEARAAKLRGKKRSPEFSKWLSRVHTGRKASDEARQKMSAARTGLKRSASAIERTAQRHRGMRRSDEARAHMSASQPKRPVTNVTIGRRFESVTGAAAWLRSIGHDRAGKAGVVAACKRGGTYLGHAWVYADAAAQS